MRRRAFNRSTRRRGAIAESILNFQDGWLIVRRPNPTTAAASAINDPSVARHGKLPPRRHEELPPPWLAEERANARGANHGKPIVE